MIYQADITAAQQQADRLDPALVQQHLQRITAELDTAARRTKTAARLRRQREWWNEVAHQQSCDTRSWE